MYQVWMGILFWSTLLCLPAAVTAQEQEEAQQEKREARQEQREARQKAQQEKREARQEQREAQQEKREAFRKCVLEGGSWKDCSQELDEDDSIRLGFENPEDAHERPFGGIWSPTAAELILKNRGK